MSQNAFNCSCFLPVIATADNCLMTSYKFLAVHQADFHIIYDGLNEKETGTVKEKGEFRITSLVPSLSAIKSPTEKSNATESTSFGPQSSTYEESSFSSSTVKSRESDNKGSFSIDLLHSIFIELHAMKHLGVQRKSNIQSMHSVV